MAEVLDTPVTEETQAPELTRGNQDALVALVRKVLTRDKYSRRMEVIEARRQRYYDRGDQYIYYDSVSYQFKPAGDSGEELPTYTDVYNIYTPHRRSLTSVLSQNPPGINFVPDDLGVSADVTAANRAEKMRNRIDRDIRMKDVQTDVARLFCTDGRVVAETFVKDGKACCEVGGVLEWKVPVHARDMKECGYAVNSREIDINAAKDEHPDVADAIEASEDSSGESSFERYCRLGVLGGNKSQIGGRADTKLVTRHRAYLRPSQYRELPDGDKAAIKASFPDGVRVVVISNQFCKAESVSMDDCLAVGFPAPGDGMHRPSLLKDMVPLCDAFNDGMNMLREHFDFSIPATWLDRDAVDEEALPEQRSSPGMMHLVKVPQAKSITDIIMQESVPQLAPELVGFLEQLSGQLSQFITGDLPSLYGGSTPDVETASGQAQAKEQAMGGLSPAWAGLQALFAQVYFQGINALSKALGDTEVSIPGSKGSSDSFPASDLSVGSYGAYPDTDSSFPETTAAKKAALQQVLTLLGSMDGGDQIALQNLSLIKHYSGLADLEIPGAAAEDKQLREIDQLLKEQPIGWDAMQKWQAASQQAQQMGMQPPPQPPALEPSVGIDEVWDFHLYEKNEVQDWLSSDERVQEDRAGNQAGVENVKLHGALHTAALQKQQAPPTGKPPSVSIALKDVSDPNAKAQILQEAGIQTTPDALQEGEGAADAKEVIKKIVN